MNQYPPEERLYKLLPAIYQIRDQVQGETLRALLAIAAGELQVLEEDIARLYENWFIETCDGWVVPYIGDLLDVQQLYAQNVQKNISYGQQQRRAYIANTIAYRRRKGTAPILEQLTRDITDWRARAVEFSQRLATTQNLNHLRLKRKQGDGQGESLQFNNTTVNLRQSGTPEFLGTPFEQQVSYSIDTRRMTNNVGLYNIPNIGLYIWRLQSYPIEKATARMVKGPESEVNGRYYTFNPLGYEQFPLFNQPQTETDILHLAEEINVPSPLRRPPLKKELEQRRHQLLEGKTPSGISYFDADPVLQIFINGQQEPIPPEEILIDNLTEITKNGEEENQEQKNDETFPRKVVAVDPESGRLAFLNGIVPHQVEVSYLYGFSGDIGGGPYERPEVITKPSVLPLIWDVNRATAAQTNPLAHVAQTWNQSVVAWLNLWNGNYIPIGKLVIPEAPKISISDTVQEKEYPKRPQFKPGIICGLQIHSRVDSNKVTVTPGSAVDRQGRLIKLDVYETVEVKPYQDKKGNLLQSKYLLVISYKATAEGSNFQFDTIPEAANNTFSKGRFIPLALLDLDGEGNIERLLESEDVRLQFAAGIVNGLEVKQPTGRLQVIVTAGTAVDSTGRAFTLSTNHAINCHQHLGKEVVVAIIASERVFSWRSTQIQLMQKTELNSDPNKFYIPLAYLDIPQLQLRLSSFAHIKSGLQVQVVNNQSPLKVKVSPGVAVDSQGVEINLPTESKPIDLAPHQGGIVQLVITTGINSQEGRGNIKVLQLADIKTNPDAYILMAELDIPNLNLQNQQLISIRPVPRITNGLKVIPKQSGAIATVEAGDAIDSQGRTISLENSYEIDLSAYWSTNQLWRIPTNTEPSIDKFTKEYDSYTNLFLFISHQAGQGLPGIEFISPKVNPECQQLGLVPAEPQAAALGKIILQDNGTYEGDVNIIIPADKKLQIIAANGYRPHLHGNLYIQGVTPSNSNPGELILEGLLVQGKLTVLPGNFRSLQVNHCTLVPKQGGLTVTAVEIPDEEDGETSDEGLTLIAIAIYFLNVIRNLLGDKNPKQSLELFLRIAIKQAQLVLSQLRELIQWRCLEEFSILDRRSQPNGDSLNFKLDNSQLSVNIYRSICGALDLAETVPKLLIEDSIIDNGWSAKSPQAKDSSPAIAALGTTVERLHTSTVFGHTKVRSLEASDSIFTGRVTTLRKQIGCMRFCYLPYGSQTPRRYLCQPDRALAEQFDLDKLPPAITCLAINPHKNNPQENNPQENNPQNGQLFAGTAGKGVFSYRRKTNEDNENNQNNQNNDPKWEPINEGLTNLNVTALLYGSPYIYAGAVGGSIFRREDNGNTWVEINSTEEIEVKGGTGKISSAGKKVEGNKQTVFATELGVGDIITAAGQSRIVTQIKSDKYLSLNAPFEPNLDNNNFSITISKPNTDITAFALNRTTIFAATVGGGVFRFFEDERGERQKWTAVNNGITNLKVTSLAVGVGGELFAGTGGGGVFRSLNNGERWTDINIGLKNLGIIALAVDVMGFVFAGTSDGGVFRFDPGNSTWTAVNQGLTNLDITALATYRQRGIGTISSDGKTVNGDRTNFADDLINRTITAGGQTRTVKKWESPTKIILDKPFCPDLPPGTSFTCDNFLIVGTVGGDLLYSQNHGENWRSANAGLSDTDVSDITIVDNSNGAITIYVSTTVGNILCSLDWAKSWRSLNRGLVNVEEKLLILSRVQIRFTSSQYSDPGYAQLSNNCAIEIRTGAEDGSEIGVFSYLKQPQRQSNLEASLKEYLRFGLEVSIFYMT